ncbi:MAG: hypothetical protein V7K54_21020 [Nostoc sp.]
MKTSCDRKKPFCGIPLSSNSDNTTPDISLAIAVIALKFGQEMKLSSATIYKTRIN